MDMMLDQTQFFTIIVGVMALVGFVRGWAREVITCAVVLAAVLFLLAGGDELLARLMLGHLPGPLSGLASDGDLTMGLAALAGALALGYWLGNHLASEPARPHHRLAGMIPGVVIGTALIFYLSEHLTAGTRLALSSPSDAQARADVTLVYGIGFGVLVLLVLYSAIAGRGK